MSRRAATAGLAADAASANGSKIVKVGDPVFTEQLAVSIDKSGPPDADFVTAVNKIVDDMHKDGTLSAMSKKWFDNLDLALHVLRQNAKAVIVCAAIGILPIAVLNHVLVVHFDDRMFSDNLSGLSFFMMTLLVLVEAPLA